MYARPHDEFASPSSWWWVVAVIGALVGLVLSAGVLLVVSGLRGVDVVEKAAPTKPALKATSTVSTATAVKRAAIAVGLFVLLWWQTGWPMAGATAAAISLVVPALRAAQRERDQMLNRAEELARWCEMLRDSMPAGMGLKRAIDATARPKVAGRTIRVPVRVLSDRCEEMAVSTALRMFADDVADPICDQIVTSLVMAEERGGKELVPVLSEIVSSVRRRASMRRRVEVGRARVYAATRAMVMMTIGLALLATLFASSFMEPFDSAGGQFWMGVIGAIFTGAVWAMVPLSRPEPDPRLLAELGRVAVA